MQRVELSGWLGLLIILGSSLAGLFIVLILPSMVATAFWNALVYETLGGPLVGLQQGFLIWAMVCVALYGIFRPTINIVIDEADLAKMDDVDFKFRPNKTVAKTATEKQAKKELTSVSKPKTPRNTPEKPRTSTPEEARFSLRSAAAKETTPAPSAHWLKWRKQQAEALQLAAEANKTDEPPTST
jgi:hypothetical protein